MQITITIETGNAAFQEDTCGPEVARILRKAADRIDGCHHHDLSVAGVLLRLHDINGNFVGTVEVQEGDEGDGDVDVRHTSCRYCGQDIEGYRDGEDWRDRGNNRQCPPYERNGEIVTPPEGQRHAPTCDACNPDTPGWIGANKCRACNQEGRV